MKAPGAIAGKQSVTVSNSAGVQSDALNEAIMKVVCAPLSAKQLGFHAGERIRQFQSGMSRKQFLPDFAGKMAAVPASRQASSPHYAFTATLITTEIKMLPSPVPGAEADASSTSSVMSIKPEVDALPCQRMDARVADQRQTMRRINWRA